MSDDADQLATVFCPSCGRPVNETGRTILRREADWHGVRLQLSEKITVAAVVGLGNAIAALAVVFSR